MAFVSRAERKIDFKQGSTNAIGPGAYQGHAKYKAKKGYAPFGSTNNRETVKPVVGNPGPGSYSSPNLHNQSQAGYDQYGNFKPSGAFASKDTRFKYKQKEDKPGPGSYNLGQKWVKRPRKDNKQEWSSINWLRLPSAPSIPASNQVFGYDETATGDLIMQKNPEKVFTGMKGDSVGPGHYQSKNVINQKGPDWAKSKVKRVPSKSFATSENLGPGSYSLSVGTAPKFKHNQSAVFKSKSQRNVGVLAQNKTMIEKVDDESSSEDSGDEGIPGPGTYLNNESFSAFKNTKVPTRLQFFGSTEERFRSHSSLATGNLGPGYYGSMRKPVVEKRTGQSKAPFASTKMRFQHEEKPNPGPGTYVEQQLTENLNKKTWGRQGVFGTTERRFVGPKDRNTPGPAHYPPDAHKRVGIHNSAVHKPNSVFQSKIIREEKPTNVDHPPPGAYEVQGDLVKKTKISGTGNPMMAGIGDSKKREAGFNSKQTRWQDNSEINESVGPGAYQVSDAMTKSASTGTFIPRGLRFDKSKGTTPAPGQYYDEDTDAQWNKKSYNIIFSDIS